MKTKNFLHNVLNTVLVLSATTVITLTATSCSNDDDPIAMAATDQQAEKETAARQADNSETTQQLLEALCCVDPETKAVKEPRLGRVLYPTTPTVSYAIANTPEEAETRYRTLVANIKEGLTAHDVSQGDIHLTFTPGTGGDETGRIIVDCPRLQSVLTAIVFVTEARWPQNDIASQINYFSVWRNKKTGLIYACVKPANPDTGYMLCMEDKFPDSYCFSIKDGKKPIDMLAKSLMDYPQDYRQMYERVQDVMMERGGGFGHFFNFKHVAVKISGAPYKDGSEVVRINHSSGYSIFKCNRMPEHRSGEAKGIYSDSFTFERETRLDTNLWECLKY